MEFSAAHFNHTGKHSVRGKAPQPEPMKIFLLDYGSDYTRWNSIVVIFTLCLETIRTYLFASSINRDRDEKSPKSHSSDVFVRTNTKNESYSHRSNTN